MCTEDSWDWRGVRFTYTWGCYGNYIPVDWALSILTCKCIYPMFIDCTAVWDLYMYKNCKICSVYGTNDERAVIAITFEVKFVAT